MSAWHSFYTPESANTSVETTLKHCLSEDGYTAYNPFGLMPSKPYRITVRLFVAPPRGGWVRVIGEVPAALCAQVSTTQAILAVSLRGADAAINAYARGEAVAMEDWLSANKIDLQLSRLDDAPPLRIAEQKHIIMGLDDLPEDVRRMAQGVDTQQAAKMFERMSSTLMRKAGGDAQSAQALLQQQDAPDWNSAGGGRIRQLAAALGLGDGWREPDFITLRDAYQASARRQRRPDAPLLPGDAEALAAVPDALAYTPVFVGKDT